MVASHWLDRWRRAALTAAMLTAALIWLADWLFYGQPRGWTLGLYLVALTAALLARPAARGTRTVSWLLAVLLVGLAASMAVEPGPLPIMLALIGLIVLATARRSGWQASAAAWASRLGRFAGHALTRPVRDMELVRRWIARRPHGSRRWGARALAAWGLPIALSLVFIGLFWLANPVLDLWSHQLGDWIARQLRHWSQWFNAWRILFWLMFAVAVWGLLRVRGRQRRRSTPMVSIRPGPAVVEWGSTAVVVRCLILFNLVFAGQLLLDARYLLAGAELPEGMTYAHYAHRGAYPLMATALLAGAFALVTFRSHGPAEQSAAARRLVYLWIAQNLILLGSAAWRLRMYVDVYSLTMWRIAAAIWMGLVAAGLVWIVLRIVHRRSNIWLLRMNLLTALVVLYVCCFMNFAGWIAWFNVSRCREVGGAGVPIDLAYLERLGPQALPAVRWLRQHAIGSPRDDSAQVAVAADDIARRLEHTLDTQLDQWRSWTLLRQRVASE